MIHRFDPHVHSWYSADAAHPPERLIEAAKAVGLSAMAITDHDSCDVHQYLLNEGLASAEGEPVDGLLVVPGVEVSTADGHLLCLGVTLPVMRGHPAAEVFAAVEEQGGIAIPAHPYDRWRSGIREKVLDQLELKAIEVFNSAVTSRSYNRRARAYAQARGLVGTAGSDAHHASAVGIAFTLLDLDHLNVRNLVDALKTRAAVEENYMGRREGLKKHFGNWFRSRSSDRPRHGKK